MLALGDAACVVGGLDREVKCLRAVLPGLILVRNGGLSSHLSSECAYSWRGISP
jgi:hypothetical protein